MMDETCKNNVAWLIARWDCETNFSSLGRFLLPHCCSTGIEYNILQTQIMSQSHGFLACYAHLILLKRKPCLDNEQVKKGKKGGNIGSHIFTI